MKRRGFTLLELLVVFATIAIVAAIVTPVVFARARKKAREERCQLNLKQISLAFLIYQGDEDHGSLPDSLLEKDFALEKYLSENPGDFNCPADLRQYVEGKNGLGGQVFSYGWNVYSLKQAAGKQPVNTQNIPLVFDSLQMRVSRPCIPLIPKSASFEPLALRHNDGLNLAFFDGHVKWVNREAIVKGSVATNYGAIPIIWGGTYIEEVPRQTTLGFPNRVKGVGDGLYVLRVVNGQLEKVAGPIKTK